MTNIITIDLEDWHSLFQKRLIGKLPPPSKNIFRQVDRLLNLLDENDTRATFFVLGVIAENFPELIKRIASRGHEIASHGYSHMPVHRISSAMFKEETQKSKNLLEDLTGIAVNGYRAPEFSIIRKTLWALESLAELGFSYDSSIFPIYHRRYGIHDFPQLVREYSLPNSLTIIEIPLSTFSLGKFKFPFAGGGYFRLMPLKIIQKIITKQNNDLIPVITYFHPYEFDPIYLNIYNYYAPKNIAERLTCWRYNLHQNLGRRSIYSKLSALLKDFRFTTCQEYLAKWKIEKSNYNLHY